MTKLYLILILGFAWTPILGQEFKLQFQSKSDSAIVYVYREKNGQNSLISPGIEINGEERLLLKNSTYTYFKLDSGDCKIGIKLSERYEGTSEVNIDLKMGQAYFVKMSTQNVFFGDLLVRQFDLKLIDSEIALSEIVGCKYLDPVKSKKLRKSILVDN